jgi:hypothetical protein
LRVAIFCGIGSAAMAEDSSRSGADPLCCKDAVIADYHDVNPKYGSLADFQAFLAAGGGQTSHVARVLPCLPAEFRLSNQIEL